MRVLLCDFHRLQAWWRWINTNANGVPASAREKVFNFLRWIAKAPTLDKFNRRVNKFKQSTEYKRNSFLQRYWRQHWASCVSLWARCYRLVSMVQARPRACHPAALSSCCP